MNFMKYNVVIALVAIIIISSSIADEAKSSSKQQQQQIQQSQNNVPLSSSVNDAKQQNKRLAYFAPSTTLNSGFKPITGSYPTATSFVTNNHYTHQHYPQPYASGVSNSFMKYPYGGSQQQFVSPSSVKFSSSSSSPSSAYNRGVPLTYGYNNNYQQLAFAASQPAAVHSYFHSPYQLAQQIFAQQLPLHNYNVHQLTPLIHAPTMGIFGSYQFPSQFGSLNKYPQISSFHQAQTSYNVPQPSSPKHHHNNHQQQQQHLQIITSKPVALESPTPSSLSPSSSSSSASQSSEVQHNQHGAISYSKFLHSSDKSYPSIPTAAALIATQPPPQPHEYYHHHQAPPQTFVDYTKHSLPNAYSLQTIASDYYSGLNGAAAVQPQVPYAHISRISVIPTPSIPAPQVVSVSVVPTIPQKNSLH